MAKRFSEASNVSETDKKPYTTAAKQFRLPHWDYYRPRDYEVTLPGRTAGNKPDTITAPYDYRAPQIFTPPEIMVKTLPDNKLVNTANPFFQFEFGNATDKIEWGSVGLDTVSTTNEKPV